MYVARDKDGTLYVFFNKPVKGYIFERWQSVSVYSRDYLN